MPLTGDIQRSSTTGRQTVLVALPVLGGATLYTGALICSNANGLAIPGADAAGLTFQGVAFRGMDNSGGADGVMDGPFPERTADIDTALIYSFPFQGTTPKPGDRALVVDDATCTVDATTNNIDCGRVTEPDPGKSGWWFVDPLR